MAVKNHPDRGGSKEEFQKIQEAGEHLKDDEKRAAYDRHGEDALKEGGGGRGGGGGGMGDIFDLFGGGRGGRGPQRDAGPKKGKPVQYPLKVTLEEIYNGKQSKIAVNRERICNSCDGLGGKAGAVQKCTTCKGRGIVTKMQMLGPGMYS